MTICLIASVCVCVCVCVRACVRACVRERQFIHVTCGFWVTVCVPGVFPVIIYLQIGFFSSGLPAAGDCGARSAGER